MLIRRVEAVVLQDFFAAITRMPTALVIEGDAGSGKTTMWLAARRQARDTGIRVLSTRGACAGSVLAYSALADMFRGVEADVPETLPGPQRRAVDRVLLRTESDGVPTDRYALATAFQSVLQMLSAERPLVVAIDDLQWIDPSSARVMEFAAHRLPPRIGIIATVRTPAHSVPSWLTLAESDGSQRLRMAPYDAKALHAIVEERLGQSFSKPTMIRIHQESAGNPFYAIELARSLESGHWRPEADLPGSLNELVCERIAKLEPDVVSGPLLAAACLANPTVALVARAARMTPTQLLKVLARAEDEGVISVAGPEIRFTHPLLARGVYGMASGGMRRRMHKRLAGVIEPSELRARHLALAATEADPETLCALDEAAEVSRSGGAPAAAAELLDLAIGLGGDTPERRIRSAACRFDGGEPMKARTLLEDVIEGLGAGPLRASALCQLGLVRLYGDSFNEAAGLLDRALSEAGDDAALRIRIQTLATFAWLIIGDAGRAVAMNTEALAAAESLGQPALLSHALAMRAVLGFLAGEGLDQPLLDRALQLEDLSVQVPVAIRPSVVAPLLRAFAGDLQHGHDAMLTVRRRWIDHAGEGEASFVAWNAALIELWRADFAEMAAIVEDTAMRARQLGSDLTLFVAQAIRAAAASYAGRIDDARRDFADAIALGARLGVHRLTAWVVAAEGFLDLSVGDARGALRTLGPLLEMFDPGVAPTEITSAPFIPDAVEAMVMIGRSAEAVALVDALQANGRRLDRPWMLAIGGRCRALVLAAGGDLAAACGAAEQALAEHQRLSMPFERARTQLVLGQIQRRMRQRGFAAATLGAALITFQALDTPLWAERARAELARTVADADRVDVLTPSERRVAELVATGISNRAAADVLFLSPKTVDVYLGRIYKKLGLHSRVQLAGLIRDRDGQQVNTVFPQHLLHP